MLTSHIEAVTFFRHSAEEVAELSAAVIPLADNIRAVSTQYSKSSLRHILACEYFRAKEASTMRAMLLRAAKHAKANLGDYFPILREDILRSAQRLEEATEAYYRAFVFAQREAIPTN